MAQAPVGPEDGAGAGRPLGRPPISFTQARWERIVDRWDAEVAPVVDALAELDEAMEELGVPQARRDAVKRAVTEALAAASRLRHLLG